MVKVVIMNGMPESGKTTIQNICSHKLKPLGWKCVIESSVTWVKEIAKYAGWDGTKTDKNRKFLSDLKKLLTEWDDAVFNHLVEVVEDYDWQDENYVIFIDIREPYEIARAKKEFNATTVLVRRPSVESNTYSNSSDTEVFEYEYDKVICNYGNDLQALEDVCEEFVKLLVINRDNVYGMENGI